MSEANWYVVHTYSGYENKVKTTIEQTIENRKLHDQILEVSVPTQEVVELKNGVRKVSEKKLFPGYVLINMVMNDDTWYVVRNTRGVTGFVGPGSKPVPLTDTEMLSLGIKNEKVEVDFKEGDIFHLSAFLASAGCFDLLHFQCFYLCCNHLTAFLKGGFIAVLLGLLLYQFCHGFLQFFLFFSIFRILCTMCHGCDYIFSECQDKVTFVFQHLIDGL